jgi:3-deoxy-D-manno-octulosonic-acid transferase
MTRFVYTVLLRVLAPLVWLRMRMRAGKDAAAWEILGAARFGRYGGDVGSILETHRIWVHAVSLGETRAAQPLIRALLGAGYRLLLTHTTPTGRAEGGRLFKDEIESGQLCQAWLPYDFPGATQRFIRYFKPRCGVLIEREVWPNLLRSASKEGVSVLLVSARLSETSVRRSRWARRALHRAYASLDLVLAQTPADAERLRQVGAFGPHVAGNLKFDVSLSESQLVEGQRWRAAMGRQVVAVASTREGEDEMFASAIRDTARTLAPPRVFHMLIPRHPQRFNEAAATLDRAGLRFVRRSVGGVLPFEDVDVLLGDTVGEMAFYYAACDVAIIGGGFSPFGGQNLIEACAAGTPVIVGPHMHNFAQATQDAVAAGAAIQVESAVEALAAAYDLLRDRPRLDAMRSAALTWTAAHAGATKRIVEALRPWLGPAANEELWTKQTG